MGDTTKIQWATHTFNPWRGCVKVSEACRHCYAEGWAKRTGKDIWGADKPREMASESYWRQPLKWDAEALEAGERRRVFCSSLADVCEDRPDLIAPRLRLMKLILVTKNLDWLLLTKRPENFLRFFDWKAIDSRYESWPMNVWAGTTTETQADADRRLAHLVRVPAVVRFVSVEPMLEEVILHGDHYATHGRVWNWLGKDGVTWVIIGGESGGHSRPMAREWVDSLICQCREGGAAPFVKQLGACFADQVHGIAGRNLKVPAEAAGLISRRLVDPKGGDMLEWPEPLRIRELPVLAGAARS